MRKDYMISAAVEKDTVPCRQRHAVFGTGRYIREVVQA